MGNSSRKNSKSSSETAASKLASPNWTRRTKSNDDEPPENENVDEDVDMDEEDGGEQMSHWRHKVKTTSPLVQQARAQRRERRQYSTPAVSTSAVDLSCMDDEDRTGADRNRSKSIVNVRKIPATKTTPNIPAKQATPSGRRRASESPATVAQRHAQQNGSSGSSGELQLSMAQINLVRKLWQHVRVQGENGPGISILRQHLFFRCPAVRQMFATDLDGVQSEMAYHKRLITHAESLSELLDELVNNLERVHIVKDKLKHYGRLHASIRHIGFTSAFWDRFAEALNDCTLTWCQKAQRCFDAQVAWTTIALYITEQLKDGYYDECRRLRKHAYAQGKSHSQVTGTSESGEGHFEHVTAANMDYMDDYDRDDSP